MTSSRINISSRSPWEPLRGYSRAVQIDGRFLVSGTTALDERGVVQGVGDAYEQTKFIIEKTRKILTEFSYSLHDVVRTRLFVTDMKQWQQYAKAHSEAFEKIRPASSIMQISALVDPRLLIEMEFEAVKSDGPVISKALS